jgi:hypothetical protein
VKTGAGLNHMLHGKLPCSLGKMLGRRLGSGDQQRGELGGGGPAAAAEARAPAAAAEARALEIMWLGLINKRLGEILWCTRKGSGACGGEGIDWRVVRTGRRQWRNDEARGWCACARGAAGGGFLWVLEVG